MEGSPLTRLSGPAVALELARPLVLLALFVAAATHGIWLLAAPLAFATVFASSILVHDLIHGALGLPRRVNEVLLGVAAMLLVKSGHGLRVLHFEHHKRCLAEGDVEGGVAHASFVALVARGPFLAASSRIEAWQRAGSTRSAQLMETTANALLLAAGAALAILGRSPIVLVYWVAVVLVTVSAPIWGAKIPHMVPWRSPHVRRLARLTGRLTPATASVLLHELHHRVPTMPVALLPANAGLLDTTAPSRCREVTR